MPLRDLGLLTMRLPWGVRGYCSEQIVMLAIRAFLLWVCIDMGYRAVMTY